jgi:hypothetical protein
MPPLDAVGAPPVDGDLGDVVSAPLTEAEAVRFSELSWIRPELQSPAEQAESKYLFDKHQAARAPATQSVVRAINAAARKERRKADKDLRRLGRKLRSRAAARRRQGCPPTVRLRPQRDPRVRHLPRPTCARRSRSRRVAPRAHARRGPPRKPAEPEPDPESLAARAAHPRAYRPRRRRQRSRR